MPRTTVTPTKGAPMLNIQDTDPTVDDTKDPLYRPVRASAHPKVTTPLRGMCDHPRIAWVAALVTVACVAAAVVTMRANGLLILAMAGLAVFVWAVGAHHRDWWFEDDDTSRRLAAVDAELDFIESVRGDLRSLEGTR